MSDLRLPPSRRFAELRTERPAHCTHASHRMLDELFTDMLAMDVEVATRHFDSNLTAA